MRLFNASWLGALLFHGWSISAAVFFVVSGVVGLVWWSIYRLRKVVARCAALGSLCSSVYLLVGLM